MENRDLYQAEIFYNRLQKKYKELRKWARKNRITCYRLYDRDIPEIPLSLDLYEFLPEEIDSKIEAIETNDIVTASVAANPVKVSTINKVIKLDNNEEIEVEATEVRFDVSSLFGN